VAYEGQDLFGPIEVENSLVKGPDQLEIIRLGIL